MTSSDSADLASQDLADKRLGGLGHTREHFVTVEK